MFLRSAATVIALMIAGKGEASGDEKCFCPVTTDGGESGKCERSWEGRQEYARYDAGPRDELRCQDFCRENPVWCRGFTYFPTRDVDNCHLYDYVPESVRRINAEDEDALCYGECGCDTFEGEGAVEREACQVGPAADPAASCDAMGGEFCLLDTGVCNNRAGIHFGACAARPGTCRPSREPVCGCDGNTYSSECKAHMEGVSVSRAGGCEAAQPPPGPPVSPGLCSPLLDLIAAEEVCIDSDDVCEATADLAANGKESCDAWCARGGLQCAQAWNDGRDKCQKKGSLSCAATGKAASICRCEDPVAGLCGPYVGRIWNGEVCSSTADECEATANLQENGNESCDSWCEREGLQCERAWNDGSDFCERKGEISCSTEGKKRSICLCKPKPTGPQPAPTPAGLDLCSDDYPTLDLKDAFQPLQSAEQVYPDENGVTRVNITMDLVNYIGPSFTTILRHFNGGGPGPTIHVVPGGKLELNLINCLYDPIGNLAHNRYQHPNETNMHTHGPHISSQDPGDNVFVKVTTRDSRLYEYVFDENHMPGVFWYHPHLHGSTGLQTGQGSSGLLLMDEPEDYAIPAAIKDMPQIQMLFQHVNVALLREITDVDGDLVTNWVDHNFEITNATSSITNFMLINFQFLPKVTMEKGKWYRWQIGLSSVRAGLAFVSQSGNCEFQLLAKDGIFLTDAPRLIPAVILSAGNRADVAVRCHELGQEYINSTEIALAPPYGAFTPGTQYGPASTESYENPTVESRVGDFMNPEEQPTFLLIDVVPNESVEDEDLDIFNAPTPCYLVDLRGVDESEVGHFASEYGCLAPGQSDPILPLPGGGFGWPQVNDPLDLCGVFGPYGIGANNFTGPRPGWGAALIPWVDSNTFINDFATGSVQQIELVSNQFHPYHQHINPYQIIKINSKDIPADFQDIVTTYYQEGDWHDTLQYPAAGEVFQGPPTLFDVTIRFQADQFTGHMVQHCHLLFHEDQGMMAQYDVTGEEGAIWMGAREVDPQCILPQTPPVSSGLCSPLLDLIKADEVCIDSNGVCEATADLGANGKESCDAWCARGGLQCVQAWNDGRNKCQKKSPLSCAATGKAASICRCED